MIPTLNLGFLQIPTYFVVISFSLSALLIYLSFRVNQFHIERKPAFNIALILMVFGFIGGRLFHVVYEELPYYLNDPLQILFFWNGGFVFLGGLIAAWIATWIYCRLQKISFVKWADFFAPLISLSHALGRVGCILSGCCFGQFCDLPWAVAGRHPTAIYLAVGEFFIFLLLLVFEKVQNGQQKQNKTSNQQPGTLFFKWVFLHSLLRYIVEFYRDDFRGLFVHTGILGSISISQLICLILMFVATGFFIKKWFQRPRLN